ncbi:Kelch repeat-containing protein [Mucilaginibacter sp.]|uniref:Kelch repeat-containing protein n=1 Tax=Mucilaginibacter sp. TaxID=1882438 RepID=UPI0035BBCA47
MLFKKNAFLLILLCCLLSCKKEPFVPNSENALPGYWQQLKTFPGAGRVRAFGFSIGKKGYILGGNAAGGFNSFLLNDLWEYDPATDHWTKKADYPGQAAEYLRGFAINNKMYLGTGFGQRVAVPGNTVPQNNDFYEYDPATDKWTRKADFPAEPRENVIAFELNGSGYMGLGTNDSYDKNFKDFYKYDAAADKWLRVADYPGTGSFGVAAFSVNGKGYAGLGGASPSTIEKDFWQYDPVANQWTKKAAFTGKGRVFSGQFAIGNSGYVGFGTSISENLDDWYRYDAEKDSWIKITNFPGANRYDLITFVIDGIGYVGTGNPGQLDDFWKYTPVKK